MLNKVNTVNTTNKSNEPNSANNFWSKGLNVTIATASTIIYYYIYLVFNILYIKSRLLSIGACIGKQDLPGMFSLFSLFNLFSLFSLFTDLS